MAERGCVDIRHDQMEPQTLPKRPLPAFTCPLCGGPNGCAAAASGTFDVTCWCRDVKFAPDLLARVPEAQQGLACVCRRCAEAAGEKSPRP